MTTATNRTRHPNGIATMRHFVCYRVFVVILILPTVCQGFAAPNPKGILDGVLKNNPFLPSQDELVPDGEALLKELNLTISTKPKTFYAEPQQWPELLTASVPAIFRLGSGVFAEGYQVSTVDRNPSQYAILTVGKYDVVEKCLPGRTQQLEPLVIYEFEACPFCRKVREAVSMLSLTVTYKPCPKNGRRFRPEIKEAYGSKATFPFLIDPNTRVKMFESSDILAYLYQTYGNGNDIPWILGDNPLVVLSAGLGLLARGGSGGTYQASNPPPMPLVLWAYEGSPFCKLVREQLCALEIAHTQISCPRGSPNRQVLMEKTGRFQVPYLEDPNTGVTLFETQAIVEYLQKQYGVAPSPVKYL